ncbi:suppressor of tub2 mutation [Ascosphaera acerosa]|nr:suppressor of tub2 mutation [Ascosphaera acerosa]
MDMDVRAAEVVAALKNTNLSLDAKQTFLAKLKSDIKRENIPDAALPAVFDALKLALPSVSPALALAAFSTLGHVLKRLYLQLPQPKEQARTIALHGRALYPFLLDRLGDHREKIRQCAVQAFADFWPAAKADVESYVLDGALVGRNPRAKEASMLWLARMTREQGLLFRAYVPSLVACLEDADNGVRETAKAVVIELFQNAPPKAQLDLKKQLQAHNVRKSIVAAILTSIGASMDDAGAAAGPQVATGATAVRLDSARPASSLSTRRERDMPSRSASALSNHASTTSATTGLMPADRKERALSASEAATAAQPDILALAAATTTTVTTSPDGSENVEPYNVASHHELDDIFRTMAPHFEGRETEQNWSARERAVLLLRRITRGNAPLDHSDHFVAGVKALLDGILKAVNSLRTTVSTAGCALVQELAQTLGPAIDPWCELLLQTMLKVASALKKITSQNANATVDAIVANASYAPRIMQHMWFAASDKNVQPRLYVTGWLKTIMNAHAVAHRAVMEHNGGVDVLEKCIRRGLGDPNPGVREAMRGTYWLFWRYWRERADEIMEGLDPKSQKLLEKDAANPNRERQQAPSQPQQQQQTHAGRPPKANSRATPARPTLKETIAAQKRARLAAQKAAAAGGGGSEDGGVQQPFQGQPQQQPLPLGPASGNGHAARPPAVDPAAAGRPFPHLRTVASVPASTTKTLATGHSGLMSAPMRPGARQKQQQQHQHQHQQHQYPAQPIRLVPAESQDYPRADRKPTSPSPSPPLLHTTSHGQFVPPLQQQSVATASRPARPATATAATTATPERYKAHADLHGSRQQENMPPRIDLASLASAGDLARPPLQVSQHQHVDARVLHQAVSHTPSDLAGSALEEDDVFMAAGQDTDASARPGEHHLGPVLPDAPLPPSPSHMMPGRSGSRSTDAAARDGHDGNSHGDDDGDMRMAIDAPLAVHQEELGRELEVEMDIARGIPLPESEGVTMTPRSPRTPAAAAVDSRLARQQTVPHHAPVALSPPRSPRTLATPSPGPKSPSRIPVSPRARGALALSPARSIQAMMGVADEAPAALALDAAKAQTGAVVSPRGSASASASGSGAGSRSGSGSGSESAASLAGPSQSARRRQHHDRQGGEAMKTSPQQPLHPAALPEESTAVIDDAAAASNDGRRHQTSAIRRETTANGGFDNAVLLRLDGRVGLGRAAGFSPALVGLGVA